MDRKKNLLVVCVDQLRQDALRCYGNDQVITPNLDALCDTATAYDEHFCSYPICTPSRFSCFTGLYCHQNHVWTNKGSLLPTADTWAKQLQRNGWHTAAVGKMHAFPTYTDFGFDEMRLAEQDGDGRFDDDYHEFLYENGLIDAFDLMDQRAEYRAEAPKEYWDSFGAGLSDIPEKYYSTTWVTDESMKILDGWEGGGNVLYTSYIKPHRPFDPVQRFIDMYDGVDIRPLPGWTDQVPEWDYGYAKGYIDNAPLTEDAVKLITKYYYASITHIDEGIGKMVELLKEKGLYDDTMIVFTSDHGEFLGFHHMVGKGNHMYDPIMRIPLIIKRPGEKKASVCHNLSDNTQTSNEILHEMGLSGELNGYRNLLSEDRKYVLGMCRKVRDGKDENAYMLRSKKYKLLITAGFDDIALFDMENDPLEMNDISKLPENRAIVEEMARKTMSMLVFERPSFSYMDGNTKTAVKDRDTCRLQHGKLEEYFGQILRK